MGKALDRRIRKLERAAGGLPCQKPGHNELFLFVQQFDRDELDAKDQAKIQSIRECEKCKKQTRNCVDEIWKRADAREHRSTAGAAAIQFCLRRGNPRARAGKCEQWRHQHSLCQLGKGFALMPTLPSAGHPVDTRKKQNRGFNELSKRSGLLILGQPLP